MPRTETDYTRQLVKAVKDRLPTAVAFKHADMFTMGVPDFSVTLHGNTTWFEAKRLDQKCVKVEQRPIVIVRPAVHVPAIQWENLRRLMRGWLVVYTEHGHALTHVSGFRESVGVLRLQLMPMIELANSIVSAAQNECAGAGEEKW